MTLTDYGENLSSEEEDGSSIFSWENVFVKVISSSCPGTLTVIVSSWTSTLFFFLGNGISCSVLLTCSLFFSGLD